MALNGSELLSGIQATGLDNAPDALAAIDPTILDSISSTAGSIYDVVGDILPNSFWGYALAGALYVGKRAFSKEGFVYPGQDKKGNFLAGMVGAGMRAGVVAGAVAATPIGWGVGTAALTYWNLKTGADKKRMQKNAEFTDFSDSWLSRISRGTRNAIGIVTQQNQISVIS